MCFGVGQSYQRCGLIGSGSTTPFTLKVASNAKTLIIACSSRFWGTGARIGRRSRLWYISLACRSGLKWPKNSVRSGNGGTILYTILGIILHRLYAINSSALVGVTRRVTCRVAFFFFSISSPRPVLRATPPGLHANHIPKRLFAYVYVNYAPLGQGAVRSPAAEVFFWRFRLRGNQGGNGSITTHVRIPADLGGGALSIKRCCTDSFLQGVAFRLPEPDHTHGKPLIIFIRFQKQSAPLSLQYRSFGPNKPRRSGCWVGGSCNCASTSTKPFLSMSR